MAETKNGNDLSEIAAALVKVQGELHAVKASQKADTGSYSYGYADLAAVWDLVRPLLSKHGIAVVQMPEDITDGNTVRLRTMLLHTSGQRIYSTLPMPCGQNSPQSVGSALTYARRYALCAMLGVATEGEDDDGQRAEQAKAAPSTGDVCVTRVERKATKKAGTTQYLVHFSDGTRYSTIVDALGALAEELKQTGEAVTYETKQNGQWENLTAIHRTSAEPDADEPPVPQDDDLVQPVF